MKFFRHSVFAVFGKKFMTIFEFYKCILALFNLENDASAVSAVAAAGSALGDIFFAVESDASVSAVAGLYIYITFIYKHIFSCAGLIAAGKAIKKRTFRKARSAIAGVPGNIRQAAYTGGRPAAKPGSPGIAFILRKR
ncbi:hypothetical protein SDC9_125968 [bioreactor metagenome]|uniref:Uncharacterized protein n=1 Tax=bioreactor metagenome TaxID=1076179 RepID=A0A645CPV8_9ZZZZ